MGADSPAVPDVAGRDLAPTRDETVPTGRWAFDAEVTAAFDDMLQRSIPDYQRMRELVAGIAGTFAQGNDLLDLGCSRGEAMASVAEHIVGDGFSRYVGLEVSAPMAAAARLRFADDHRFDVRTHDLRDGLPENLRCDVVLSILTLQFVPIEHRQRLLDEAIDRLRPGGALLLVEKVLGAGRPIERVLVDRYHDLKRAHGYSADAVERKALALEGVLVPVTAEMNVELLRMAGFRAVDCFWRYLNFAGFLAVA